MRWIGWDGSVWSLSDESNGTVMLPGVRGMNMPPVIHHRAAHASLAGARWRGHAVDVREVFWPIQIYTDAGSTSWLSRDRDFWKTMDPTKTGTWQVIQPDGTTRSLVLRFVDDGGQAFQHDPALRGWVNYGITLEAEQPYWTGEAITGKWETGADSQFFGATGGPPFNISPSNPIGAATMTNPGDVEGYITWRIYGPITAATVGVDGRTISVPFTIIAGEVLEIDTSPTGQIAMQGPVAGPLTVDKTPNLGAVDFAPIPGRGTSTMSLSLTGTGYITATFTPRYYRAW